MGPGWGRPLGSRGSWPQWRRGFRRSQQEHGDEAGSDWGQSNWSYRPWGQQQWGGYWRDAPASEEQPWLQEAPELLPEYVQGWYLLADSGLETGEKNMIIAALKGSFDFANVAQELRNQWSDEDLRRRDQQGRHHGMWANEDDELSPAEDEGDAWMNDDQLSEEGHALVAQAQQEVFEAQAKIDQGRRTLKQARARQHQVRMSRRYYRTSYSMSQPDRAGTRPPHGSGDTCLKCGGRHKTADCRKGSGSANVANSPEDAPFVCFTEQALASGEGLQGITTKEAVLQGKAVIEGGATKTLGSVTALQHIMDLNQGKGGDSGVSGVDLSDRPIFGFGNSSRDQCVSTAKLSISADQKPGHLKIHALDKGEGPVLFSIDSLRSLGAVIDFAEDLLVFRRLNDRKIVQLERSSTGHQLLPLTTDWYEDAVEAKSAVPSLRDFVDSH